jgi:hypothetical protein
MVVFLHHAVQSCPAVLFSNFDDAHGRFLVFASANKVMTDGQIISPAASITTSVGNVGSHDHFVPVAEFSFRAKTDNAVSGVDDIALLYSTALTGRLRTSISGNAHLGLPYVQLRTCKVNSGLATTTPVVHPSSNLIFFYDGQTCPGAWREASSRTDMAGKDFSAIVGRMIFNLYNSATSAGQVNTDGLALTCASGACGPSGHASHYHAATSKVFNPPKINSGKASTGLQRTFVGEFM